MVSSVAERLIASQGKSPDRATGTIELTAATVLVHQHLPGDQHILRLHAPGCARTAVPGQFVHLQCHPLLPLRRPFSILRAAPQAGWIELLYKVVGHGTRLLSGLRPDDTASLLGPIGNGFHLHPARPRTLLIGGGVGIPPLMFLAEVMGRHGAPFQPVLLMGSEVPFPFATTRSRIPVPGLPADVDQGARLLENLGVPSRLASRQPYPGCYRGLVTEMALQWLQALAPEQRAAVGVYACGPHAMLRATAALAHDHGLPCQLSLEEFMACAVGGCAGCTVRVHEAGRASMQRVCVDGPVFAASGIFPLPEATLTNDSYGDAPRPT